MTGSLQRLAGRRLVLTGAASGMGEAMARLFAAEGATLFLLDVQEHRLTQVAGELCQAWRICDVSNEQQVNEAMAAAAKAMGGFDGLLNVAGILLRGGIMDGDFADFQRVVAVNLAGPYLTCRAAIPFLKASGRGTIVNIASLAGVKPQPGMTAYSATKAGLIALSQAMSGDVGPEVRVNVICPGVIETPMTDFMRDNGSNYDLAKAVAVGRAGTPLEVAQAALFLTSGESSFVNGTNLVVSGGHYR